MNPQPVADLGGGAPGARPPYGPKFSQFHAVFREIWQNHMLAPPPGGLTPPPTDNPGSAPDNHNHYFAETFVRMTLSTPHQDLGTATICTRITS